MFVTEKLLLSLGRFGKHYLLSVEGLSKFKIKFVYVEGSGTDLRPEQIQKAQKYCKWAGSALNYDDVPEAIMNLQKALKLLTTGDDS